MIAPVLPRSTALVEAGREWSAQLTEPDARALTAQIRTSVEELLPLIRTAYQRRADLALGYASWEAYCDGELVGLRLAVADRREAVAGLRGDGMSQRAIASALGVGQSTVRDDLAQLSGSTQLPDRITGTDGREHPATRPTPTPGPVDSTTLPADPGTTPAPAADAPAPSQEPVPTPEPAAAPSTAPAGSGQGEAVAPVTADAGAAAEPGRCEKCGVVLGSDEAAEGYLRCEPCDPNSMHYSAPPGSPCLACDPEARLAAVAETAPEFVKPVEPAPVLRLEPTADEKRAAVQRDARGLLLRAVEILAPAHDRPGYAATWARQLGPYDAELSDLIRRATEAMTTLDDLISEAGK